VAANGEDDFPQLFRAGGIAFHLRVAETAHIIFHHDTGRVELTGFATPDAAALAFWRAVARLAPPGLRVELPAEWGDD
jgi:hypothetical protein